MSSPLPPPAAAAVLVLVSVAESVAVEDSSIVVGSRLITVSGLRLVEEKDVVEVGLVKVVLDVEDVRVGIGGGDDVSITKVVGNVVKDEMVADAVNATDVVTVVNVVNVVVFTGGNVIIPPDVGITRVAVIVL